MAFEFEMDSGEPEPYKVSYGPQLPKLNIGLLMPSETIDALTQKTNHWSGAGGTLLRRPSTRAELPAARRYLRRCLVGLCFPFLPQDFDNRYFQDVPDDQQIPCLRGGEDVLLLNLTPQERAGFRIPDMDVPVTSFLKKGGHETVQAVIDTLLIDTDALQVQLTWRVSRPHDAICTTMRPEMYAAPVGCLSPADQ